MTEKEKARPTVAAVRQASENKGVSAFYSPCNCTTVSEMTQGTVESVLCHGAENAIPAAQLVEILGLKDSRELRHLVSREREKGSLILADVGGYYLPSSGTAGQAELMRFERVMHARAVHSLKVSNAVRKALQILPEQVTLSDLNQRGWK